jgi:hypothetical protein
LKEGGIVEEYGGADAQEGCLHDEQYSCPIQPIVYLITQITDSLFNSRLTKILLPHKHLLRCSSNPYHNEDNQDESQL